MELASARTNWQFALPVSLLLSLYLRRLGCGPRGDTPVTALGFLSLPSSRWRRTVAGRDAAGVAAAVEWLSSGGAEGTERRDRHGTVGTYRARAHLLSGRKDNGRGVLIGAARRLLLPRLPSLRAAWRAISRDTCRRARFKSRYVVYVTLWHLICAPVTVHYLTLGYLETNFITNYVPHANFDCCLLYALRVNDECVSAILFSEFQDLNFKVFKKLYV